LTRTGPHLGQPQAAVGEPGGRAAAARRGVCGRL